MDFWTNVGILAVSLGALALAGQVTVSHAVALARRLNVSDLTVGFLAVSIATTLPELVVSVVSVVEGQGGLAVGNVLGSNIVNLSLVLGAAAWLGRIVLHPDELSRLAQLMLAVAMVPLGLVAFGLSWITGTALLAGYAAFVWTTLHQKAKTAALENGQANHALVHAAFMLGAGVGLAVAAHGAVQSATSLAFAFGVSQTFIGATLIALGTSLPELVVAIQSMRKNHHGIALGNLLGASVTNLTLNLGLASLIGRLVVPPAPTMALALLSFVLGGILLDFVRTKKALGRSEARVLLAFFAAYVLLLLGIEWA